MNTSEATTVVVVGAGISGLTAAYRMQRYAEEGGKKLRLLILDNAQRAGGVVESALVGESLVERGPESFIASKPSIMELVDELGLNNRLVESTAASRRTMVGWHSRLHALPEGFVLFAPTRLLSLASSGLFSLSGKLRMALDLLIPPSPASHIDESLAQFVRRRLGQEALERLAEPLVGGIYSGDPETLSASATVPKLHELEQEFGSLIRGLWHQTAAARKARGTDKQRPAARFVSFDGGLQVLIDALVQRLPADAFKFGTNVKQVVPGMNKRWRVICANGEAIEADGIVVATPAIKAAELLRETDSRVSAQLAAVPYNNAVVLNAVFRNCDIGSDLKASGFVVPAVEGKLLRACTFSSVKFANRAPADAAVLRFYARDSGGLTDKVIIERLLTDARQFLPLWAEPIYAQLTRHPGALPQYTVGHAERMLRLQQLANRIPAFALAGNAYRGVGIPDCIASGNLAAGTIAGALFPA